MLKRGCISSKYLALFLSILMISITPVHALGQLVYQSAEAVGPQVGVRAYIGDIAPKVSSYVDGFYSGEVDVSFSQYFDVTVPDIGSKLTIEWMTNFESSCNLYGAVDTVSYSSPSGQINRVVLPIQYPLGLAVHCTGSSGAATALIKIHIENIEENYVSFDCFAKKFSEERELVGAKCTRPLKAWFTIYKNKCNPKIPSTPDQMQPPPNDGLPGIPAENKDILETLETNYLTPEVVLLCHHLNVSRDRYRVQIGFGVTQSFGVPDPELGITPIYNAPYGEATIIKEISHENASGSLCITRPLNDDIIAATRARCSEDKDLSFLETCVKSTCNYDMLSADGRKGSCTYENEKCEFGGAFLKFVVPTIVFVAAFAAVVTGLVAVVGAIGSAAAVSAATIALEVGVEIAASTSLLSLGEIVNIIITTAVSMITEPINLALSVFTNGVQILSSIVGSGASATLPVEFFNAIESGAPLIISTTNEVLGENISDEFPVYGRVSSYAPEHTTCSWGSRFIVPLPEGKVVAEKCQDISVEQCPNYFNCNVTGINTKRCAKRFETTPPSCLCDDGTYYNQCSTNKPLFCQGGKLINDSNQCGCPEGKVEKSKTAKICVNADAAVPFDDSKFISQNVPSTMAGDCSYQVSLTFKNVGTSNWTFPGYALKYKDPGGAKTKFGLDKVNLAAKVSPNNDYAFNFAVTPEYFKKGQKTYNFRWGVVNGSKEFGEKSINIPVAVYPVHPLNGTMCENNGKYDRCGKCIGQTPPQPQLPCSAGQTQCSNSKYQTCSNNQWLNSGNDLDQDGVDAQCGDSLCDNAAGITDSTKTATETVCNDSKDNDCDGLTDTNDQDCSLPVVISEPAQEPISTLPIQIIQPSITLVSPNGFEQMQLESSQRISYQTTGTIPSNANVAESLIANDGTTIGYITFTRSPATNDAPWTVTNIFNTCGQGSNAPVSSIPPGQYKLKAEIYTGDVPTYPSNCFGSTQTILASDISDNIFTINPPSCSDNDDGMNYNAKGTTTDSLGNAINDACATGQSSFNLVEGYCGTDGKVASINYQCQYGCNNGACINPVCGNNVIEATESCDNTNLGSTQTSCTSYSTTFASGSLKCTSCEIDTSNCVLKPSCGDGIIESGEQCDTTNFGSTQTSCISYSANFASGTLKCTSCQFDTSSCIPKPTCTDSDNGINSQTRGTANTDSASSQYPYATDYCFDEFTVNEAFCDTDATIKLSSVTCDNRCRDGSCVAPVCGNNFIDSNEQCDTTNFGSTSTSCISYSTTFASGTLKCTLCQIDTSSCVPKPTCTDSDGGNNPSVKGTATTNELTIAIYPSPGTDTCFDENTVAEAICQNDGTVGTINVGCQDKCVDGACVIKLPSPSTSVNSELVTGITATSSNILGRQTTNQWLYQSFKPIGAEIIGASVAVSHKDIPGYPLRVLVKGSPYDVSLLDILGGAYATINRSLISTSYSTPTWVTVNFQKPIYVEPGKLLYLALTVGNLNSNAYYSWSLDSSNPYADGTFFEGTTSQNSNDALAKIIFNPKTTLPNPFVVVTHPNGDETSPNSGNFPRGWSKGDQAKITWISNGYQYVVIDLMRGSTLVKRISQDALASSKSFTWSVSHDIPDANDYKIRISGTNQAGAYDSTAESDVSDNVFTISSPII